MKQYHPDPSWRQDLSELIVLLIEMQTAAASLSEFIVDTMDELSVEPFGDAHALRMLELLCNSVGILQPSFHRLIMQSSLKGFTDRVRDVSTRPDGIAGLATFADNIRFKHLQAMSKLCSLIDTFPRAGIALSDFDAVLRALQEMMTAVTESDALMGEVQRLTVAIQLTQVIGDPTLVLDSSDNRMPPTAPP